MLNKRQELRRITRELSEVLGVKSIKRPDSVDEALQVIRYLTDTVTGKKTKKKYVTVLSLKNKMDNMSRELRRKKGVIEWQKEAISKLKKKKTKR